VEEPPDEPAARASQVSLEPVAEQFPDDGPFATKLRKLDARIGLVEQAVLAALLATVVLVAGGSALQQQIAGRGFDTWHSDLIRACTVTIAMFGAALASQQMRHLSMDLISRRLAPRARLFLRVALLAFTIFLALLLVRASLYHHGVDLLPDDASLIDYFTARKQVDGVVVIGGLLIIVHSALHLAIDVDYIVRHKLPPERMRSGH